MTIREGEPAFGRADQSRHILVCGGSNLIGALSFLDGCHGCGAAQEVGAGCGAKAPPIERHDVNKKSST
jgi:hypothetical protein